jgi:hypothetical protein
MEFAWTQQLLRASLGGIASPDRQSSFAESGFSVDVVGTTELHATFREESRTSLLSASVALQEIPGER